jgi:1-acyl-sn-glycerol-3-phosphate acyltransferase
LTGVKETPWWYSLLWLIGLIIFKLLFDLRREGKERIFPKRAMIIAANHRSYLDPIVLALLVPRRMNFMAKEELFRSPIFGYLITKLGAFPLKRGKLDRAAYKKALQVLKEGKILILFPEGTRSRSGRLGKLREGPVRMALYSQVPLIPVVIKGTEKVLPPGAKFIRRGKIKIKVGEPLFFSQFFQKKEEKIKIILQQLRESMIAMGADK